MTSARRLGALVGSLTVLRVVSVCLGSLVYVIVARGLGAHDFGAYSSIAGGAAFAQPWLDQGVSNRWVVLRGRGQHRELLDTMATTRALMIPLLLVAVLVSIAASGRGLPLLLQLVSWGALWAVALNWQSTVGALLLGAGRPATGGFMLIGDRAVALLMMVLLASAKVLNLEWALVVTALSTLVSGVIFGAPVFRELSGLHVRLGSFTADIRERFGFMLTGAAAQVQNLDVLLVSILAGATEAGVLAGPSRLTTPLGLFASSVAMVVLAQQSIEGIGRLTHQQTYRTAILVAVLTCVAVVPMLIVPSVLSDSVFHITDPAVPATYRLMAVGVCLAAFNQPIAAHLQAGGRATYVAQGVCMGAAVGVLALILTAGPLGAAAGGLGVLGTQAVIACWLSVPSLRARRRALV